LCQDLELRRAGWGALHGTQKRGTVSTHFAPLGAAWFFWLAQQTCDGISFPIQPHSIIHHVVSVLRSSSSSVSFDGFGIARTDGRLSPVNGPLRFLTSEQRHDEMIHSVASFVFFLVTSISRNGRVSYESSTSSSQVRSVRSTPWEQREWKVPQYKFP
jgi:hypothetical protein